MYNFYNLQASFRTFTLSGNKKLSSVSVRNYLSDLRHFLGWYAFYLKASPKYAQLVDNAGDNSQMIGLINKDTVLAYRNYLEQNSIPIKTINRRLSTLRKFCSFCISQGWLKENPAKQVSNYGTAKENEVVLNEFKRALEQEETLPLAVRQMAEDIHDFLSSS